MSRQEEVLSPISGGGLPLRPGEGEAAPAPDEKAVALMPKLGMEIVADWQARDAPT